VSQTSQIAPKLVLGAEKVGNFEQPSVSVICLRIRNNKEIEINYLACMLSMSHVELLY